MSLLHPPPPSAAAPAPQAPSIRVEAGGIVVENGAELPPVCLRTGATENVVARKFQLSWMPPILLFTILFGPLIFIIVALVFRKRATVTGYLTESVRRDIGRWKLIATLTFFSFFGFMALGGALNNGWWMLGVPAGIVASIVMYFVKVRTIYAEKISPTSVWIRGIPPVALRAIAERVDSADRARPGPTRVRAPLTP